MFGMNNTSSVTYWVDLFLQCREFSYTECTNTKEYSVLTSYFQQEYSITLDDTFMAYYYEYEGCVWSSVTELKTKLKDDGKVLL